MLLILLFHSILTLACPPPPPKKIKKKSRKMPTTIPVKLFLDYHNRSKVINLFDYVVKAYKKSLQQLKIKTLQ